MSKRNRGPEEQPDLLLVEQLVFDTHGLIGNRFTLAETLSGRTPDFRVFKQDELVAFCEVKSPRDDRLDERLDAAEPGQIVGWGGNDPTFNRIARHISKAASQFDAVNPDHAYPNILVFVNHAESSVWTDLRETLTGFFETSDGEKIPTMLEIAEGRIGAAKRRIDGFIWLDARKKEITRLLPTESPHLETVRDILHHG